MFFGMSLCLWLYYPSLLITKYIYPIISKKILGHNNNKSNIPSNSIQESASEETENLVQSTDKSGSDSTTPAVPVEGGSESEKKPAEAVASAPQGKPPAPNWVFMIPALFDCSATTVSNIGLIFIQASVYQMLVGSVLIFSCISSVLLLKDKRFIHQWMFVCVIFAGASVVGLSSVIGSDGESSQSAKNPIFGIFMIICSQLLQSLQMVFEEKFLTQYDVIPLQCAGWEGVWGVMLCFIFLFISFWLPGSDNGSIESFPYAVVQLIRSPILILCCVGITIGCFTLNYTGITLTQRLNNTARSTIDSMRTIAVWAVSLLIGWESFNWMQISGFGLMLVGGLG